MITVYDVSGNTICKREGGTLIGDTSIWIDLLNPTPDEDGALETALSVDVPTRLEMREIEESNRFYTEGKAVYMTGLALHATETGALQTSPITFILAGDRLITVRYAETRAFPLFAARLAKGEVKAATGMAIFTGLLELIIERQADHIERIQDEMEKLAQQIFGQRGTDLPSRSRRLDVLLRSVGKEGDLSSRAQESAISLQRVVSYATHALRERNADPAIIARLDAVHRDFSSLTDSLRHLSGRIGFLLEASLGIIANEQNQIIKLFSVMAVMLMPPTLVASVYGMNFKHMPELDWPFGYPLALCLMVISALVPFFYFRRKGWM
mgnify:CR=1 FL=1